MQGLGIAMLAERGEEELLRSSYAGMCAFIASRLLRSILTKNLFCFSPHPHQQGESPYNLYAPDAGREEERRWA